MRNNRKKVLYIITKSVWGGAQKYVYDLAVNLPKNHFEPVVAGGGKGVMADKIISAGLPYFEIKSFQRDINIFKEIFSFFEILKILFKTKPDIIHISSSKAGGTAGLAFLIYSILSLTSVKASYKKINLYRKPKKRELTSVFTVHGWAFLESRPWWQIHLIKMVSKITCLFYDKIICVSHNDYKEALKNKIAPATKFVVIHNGISPDDYNFLERTEEKFTIGTIGESTKNKGHKYLREAQKNLPSIKLNIISNMSDASRYLKNFDIFVLPSIKEGLPYVILEAGLAGLPVITSNVGGIPEIIEDGKDGLLVPPKDPEALAEAIKRLVDDKSLRDTLAANLHKKIKAEFSMEKMLNATMATYKIQTDRTQKTERDGKSQPLA